MKWTLVTGGALRLGAAVCHAVAKEGKNVVIHYRTSSAQAMCLRDELIGYGVAADIVQGDFSTLESTSAFIDRYLQRFSETENVINNVGTHALGSALKTSPEEFNQLMQINAIAPFAIIQGLLGSLKQHRGAVVNIGMVGAHHIAANTHAAAYHLSKLSLAMLTKSLAKELAADHVSINMVSPGYLERSVDLPTDIVHIPAQRLGSFEEVVRAVLFFLSKESRYITGQILEVAGGVKL